MSITPSPHTSEIPQKLFKYTSKTHATQLNQFLANPRFQAGNSELYAKMMKKLEHEREMERLQEQRNQPLSPQMLERRNRVLDTRKSQQFEKEKRKVMENLRRIREKRGAVMDETAEDVSPQKLTDEPTMNKAHVSQKPTVPVTESNEETNNDSFIAKTIEQSRQAATSPQNGTKAKQAKRQPTQEPSPSKSDTSSSADLTDSMPSFHDWLKRQNSQKQMAHPESTPKSFDDWKQNRGKIRKELEESRKDLDVHLHTRRGSLSPLNTSPQLARLASPLSPVGTDADGVNLSPITIPRISHHIYRTSPSSPSYSAERKKRPWNQNNLERRPSLGRMASSSSMLSSRANSRVQSDNEDEEEEDDDNSTEYSEEDDVAQEIAQLDQKYQMIADQKRTFQRMNSSTSELQRELSSLRLMSLQQHVEDLNDEGDE